MLHELEIVLKSLYHIFKIKWPAAIESERSASFNMENVIFIINPALFWDMKDKHILCVNTVKG